MIGKELENELKQNNIIISDVINFTSKYNKKNDTIDTIFLLKNGKKFILIKNSEWYAARKNKRW